MQNPRRLLPLALLLSSIAATDVGAQVVPGMRGADMQQELQEFTHRMMQEVQRELRSWSDDWARGNPERVASYYANDGLLLLGGTALARGRHEVESLLGEVLGENGAIQVATDDFTVSGDMAYAFGRYWFRGARLETATMPATGNFLMVLRRRGRRWEIRSQVLTPAVPSATASARGSDGTRGGASQ